nr:unnamed protein product [Spirometra erinaceieuropaei]
MNAQSLISKLDELKLCLAELSPDVLAVTETWLSGNISDNEVALPEYQIYRRDREHRQGGGVVVYVNDGLAVSDNTTKYACSKEAVWLTIKATGSPCLDILTVYRPPRTDRIADTQLLEQLEKFSSRPNIMIMGDFNAPGTNWNTLQASGPKSAFDYRLLSKTLKELPTPSVSDILFSEGIVRRELEALNESKSPGPDEIPPKLLKELASELSVPLSMLFQTSFDTGTLPVDWKLAHITPLHKGGNRAATTNYRPISLTCILCKVMERIIKTELMQFLEVHGLLSKCQHGFRKGRSCTTNLLQSLQSWTRALDDRHEVHIAFIDFQKAFDTVPHQRLLHKLKKIGIAGNFLKWIENFLVGRHQVVCVGRGKSDPAMVDSGVPEGSVLGPTLFLIYVDDAARDLDCEVVMFADDMNIWSVIRGSADEDRLQMNLNRLEEWSNRWLLRFNVAKCSILRLGNTARSASTRGYFLGGAALQEVEAQRDLGVLTTSSLKPSAHCSRVAKSAMSVLYAIKRAFMDFDEEAFSKTFGTFVRPHLEYGIQAWRPWAVLDQNCLERVQRRATKMVSGQSSFPYATRLVNLHLFPLSYRQLRGDLLQAFRIVKELDCSLAFEDFFEFATTTNLRGHPLKLRTQQVRLDVRKFSFSVRVVKPWNELPADVVMSPSIQSFKKNLDIFMFRNDQER